MRILQGIETYLLVVLTLSACTSRRDMSSAHSFRVYNENGVTIAETTGGPKYEGELFAYEEVLRLHQDETREASLIGFPSMYLMDEEGAFYVPDRRPMRIACFDASGEYSHDIGRQGEGPGEFQDCEVLSAEGGVVTVYDSRLLRTSFYRTDGTFIESISIQRTRFSPDRIYRGPGGEMILLGEEDEGGFNIDTYIYAMAVVYSADGDTLASLATEKVKRGIYFLMEGNLSGISFVHYNAWPRVWYHPSSGILLAGGAEPLMRWYGLDGGLRTEIRLGIPPEPLTNADREEVLSTLRQRVADAADDRRRATARRTLELVDFSDPKGFWYWVMVDEDGYIWAMRPFNLFARPSGSPSVSRMRVLSPEGEYLGDTEWNVPGGYVSRGHLLAVQENEETGAMECVVYRIHPAVEGLKYPG